MHLNDIPSRADFPDILARFETKFMPEPMSGCWLWEASLQAPNGYGSFNACGMRIVANRASYVFYKGPIPERCLVLHKCDMRVCVNPDHLYLGNHHQNSIDSVIRGRAKGNVGALMGREDEVRSLYVKGSREFGTRALGRMFGVSNYAIFQAVRRPLTTMEQNVPSDIILVSKR